jgi:aromatic-L-amino-acid decarboxylase
MVDAGLDPSDWSELRRLGHRMVDDVVASLSTVRDRPAWRALPADVRMNLQQPLPRAPRPADKVYDEFLHDIFPYPRGTLHPRFWGWVHGSGLPLGILTEMLAAAMHSSVGAYECAATLVEAQVIGWLKQMLGWQPSASGILTSGCSVSNLIALTVARNAKAESDVRREGVAASPGMRVYASRESHNSILKAIELLGLGSAALVTVPVCDDHTIDLDALRRAVAQDRRAGRRPVCVVGNAGTVGTGAIDPLDELARFCADEGLWFHVDGAFGALAWLCPRLRRRLAGMERADSLAFDLHKWMYLPYGVGCVFVRDGAAHLAAFTTTPPYLSAMTSGPAAASHPHFPDLGIELTRPFRALKVWFCLKAFGTDGFAAAIERNVEQADYLARRVAASGCLELCSSQLNVVCFRVRRRGLPPAEEDAFNRDLLVRLQLSGLAVPSHTMLNGRFVIRVAVTNHRSVAEDFDLLVDELETAGRDGRVPIPASQDEGAAHAVL